MNIEHVTIQAGKNVAWILPQWGMNAIRLKINEEDILHSCTTMQELEQTPFLFGMPLLFPAGRVHEGKFSVVGKNYQLPVNETKHGNHLHGELYRASFVVTHLESQTVSGIYNNEAKTLFPLRFRVLVTHTLTTSEFVSCFSFTNTDTVLLPVDFAIHTAFCMPHLFTVGIGDKWGLDTHLVATGNMVVKTPVEKKLSIGINPEGKVLTGMYVMKGEALIGTHRYFAEPPFTTWVLYDGDGKHGFLCVEPQCCIGLTIDPLLIKPGETVTFITHIC